MIRAVSKHKRPWPGWEGPVAVQFRTTLAETDAPLSWNDMGVWLLIIRLAAGLNGPENSVEEQTGRRALKEWRLMSHSWWLHHRPSAPVLDHCSYLTPVNDSYSCKSLMIQLMSTYNMNSRQRNSNSLRHLMQSALSAILFVRAKTFFTTLKSEPLSYKITVIFVTVNFENKLQTRNQEIALKQKIWHIHTYSAPPRLNKETLFILLQNQAWVKVTQGELWPQILQLATHFKPHQTH